MFSALLKDSDNLLVQCRPALPAELQRPASKTRNNIQAKIIQTSKSVKLL